MSNVTSEEARKLKQCLASSLDPLQTDTGTDELDEEEHEQTDEQTDGGTEIEEQTDRQTADIDTDKRTEELQCLYLAVSSIADQVGFTRASRTKPAFVTAFYLFVSYRECSIQCPCLFRGLDIWL